MSGERFIWARVQKSTMMVGGRDDTCTILQMLALVCSKVQLIVGFLDDSAVKKPLANAGYGVHILVQEDPLEKEMTTHSNIHTWEILRTEEPGQPQSIRWQTLRHDLATEHTHTAHDNNIGDHLPSHSHLVWGGGICISPTCNMKI